MSQSSLKHMTRNAKKRYGHRLRTALVEIKGWLGLEKSAGLDPHDAAFADFLRKELGLHERHIMKLRMLAEVRGENLKTTFRKTLINLLGMVPARIAQRNLIGNEDFTSVEMEDGLTKLTLANGRVFYGFPSRQKYENIFYALRDKHPRAFSPETYEAGTNVMARYSRGADHKYFPGQGGVVIEGGAYIGLKAIRMAEVVGEAGRVIAIEIGRRNYEVMCRNVATNHMERIITPVHCGIWKEKGEMEAEFEHANWYHLATPDEHDFMTKREMVPVNTLDNIMDDHNLEVVDFLNLQLNGAEYEGLLGLDRRFNDVKILRIAAYYTRDGKPQVDVIREHLEKRGCTISAISEAGSITAVTPRWVGEFSSTAH